MKRFLTLCLMAFAILLTLCGCDSGEEADLVFINGSDTDIISVSVELIDRNVVAQNADSSPLRKGQSFGFEVEEYPVTVVVYDTAYEELRQEELGRITIKTAPSDGERWYVVAWNDRNGVTLAVDTCWPEGV